MDRAVEAVFADYDKRFEAEARASAAGGTSSYDDRSLPIGPEGGSLLNLLVKTMTAPAILELGTSNGYSTLWLAEAARATGGRVVTIEERPQKQAYARAAMTKAGLADRIDFQSGDARVLLKNLPGPFDFVLLDIWKDLYVPCLELFHPKLSTGAMVAADNMIHPDASRAHAAEYRQAVRGKRDMHSMLLPVGQGIELSRKIGGLPAYLV